MDKESLVIGFAGDVMIGRSVDSVIAQKGYDYIWGDVLPQLRHTDINVINLEAALTNSTKKIWKVFNFKASPDRAEALAAANITFTNLANNHILDFSEEGLIETIQALKKHGIRYAGAGMNKEEAAMPVLIEKKSWRVGLLGFTDNEAGWEAGPGQSGINYINITDKKDREQALAAIAKLRREAAIVIVSIHWGPNMQEEPAEEFVDFAREMIDKGADIIHGHSAHIFQGIEIFYNKLVLYDTGDFVDDYMVDPELKNDHSFFFRVEVSRNGIERVQLIPVLISNYQVNLAKEESYEWSMKRMQRLSAGFGTVISDEGEVELKTRSGFNTGEEWKAGAGSSKERRP